MTDSAPFRAPFLVIDDFMPSAVAAEMRATVEEHLGNPYGHSPQTHLDWDYWHVPAMYTYLRTLPEKVIGGRLTGIFRERLTDWSARTLGLATATPAYLSLYIDGCRQNQHNDATNGRFGFVYSLTKDARRTSGGETLIWREDDYFQTRIARPCAGSDFFRSIEPRFNRLLVFDDRVPHAVALVEGNMDPLEGRLVIHGHIREGGPIVDGPLGRDAVAAEADRLARAYATDLGNAVTIYHGPATVRFTVAPAGDVCDAGLMLDRVRRIRGGGPGVQEMLGELVGRVSQLRFPQEAAETIVTLPFGFG